MKIKETIFLGVALFAKIFSANAQGTEKMMQKYITFYYPTTNSSFYEIAFDWGIYNIVTGEAPDVHVHADSEPYKGFITMRPSVLSNSKEGNLPSYLIDKDGNVWIHQETENEIPQHSNREEVVKEGSMTSTTTINSNLEPLVDHFKVHPELWKKYGTVTTSSGGKNKLKLE